MTRQEIVGQVEQTLGFLPGWMSDMPDEVLAQYWDNTKWVLSDTKLSARDKALVAYGAATAMHCPY